LGGIFPAILYGEEKIDKGHIILGIYAKMRVHVIPGLSDEACEYDELLEPCLSATAAMKTMLVFVDGFAKRIESFIESLFNCFGLEINYIGGGAGSLSMEQSPCLFTNQGLVHDAAVIALLETRSGVGVSHGWQSVSGPYKVTEAKGNSIQSLDWQPAFQVYQAAVEDHAGKKIRPDHFFDLAKAYPFGIAKLGAERIVRDPFRVEADRALVCVGEVPQGSFVDILHGDEESLIAAARKALALSKQALAPDFHAHLCLFMDCISRVLFLGERFKEELSAVQANGLLLIGACTIGEIANSGGSYLEFYNKTAVVGLLEAL
jgi:hypothetical protein